jgi:orotate phosphoribosyltransferase
MGGNLRTQEDHSVTQDQVITLFRERGALLEGHFRLSSGLHSPNYLQCALVLQHPADAEACGRAVAAKLAGVQATCVLSPALGGLIIGHEVARALGVRAIFAERADGVLTLRRGFTLGPEDRVVIVEDVLTTGGSTRETMEAARQWGATVVAAAAVINRSGTASPVEVPFAALAEFSPPTYTPDACPLCARGLPVVKPGSRPGGAAS